MSLFGPGRWYALIRGSTSSSSGFGGLEDTPERRRATPRPSLVPTVSSRLVQFICSGQGGSGRWDRRPGDNPLPYHPNCASTDFGFEATVLKVRALQYVVFATIVAIVRRWLRPSLLCVFGCKELRCIPLSISFVLVALDSYLILWCCRRMVRNSQTPEKGGCIPWAAMCVDECC